MNSGPEKPSDAMLALDSQLCFAVYSTAHALNRVYKPLLERLGLTYPQYLVMLVLWEQENLTVKRIGERLKLDSGTLTPLLKRLEAAGLVSRARDASDERQVLVDLTEAGRKLRSRAGDLPREIAAASGCGLEELLSLKEELTALRDRLLKSAAGPQPA